jgi:hypothetical protein
VAFGLPNRPQGEIIPALKYDARAGRFFATERANINGKWEKNDVDLSAAGVPIAFLLDVRNAESGWMFFKPGVAPDFVLVPVADLEAGIARLPAQPTEDHRPGVRMLCYASKLFGDAKVREIAGTSQALINALAAVADAAKAAPEWQDPVMLPLVKLVKVVPVKTGQSTNYAPEFTIASWHVRPDDFVHVSRAGEAPASKAPPPPAQTGTGPASTTPARQPAMAGGGGRAFEDDIPFAAEFR